MYFQYCCSTTLTRLRWSRFPLQMTHLTIQLLLFQITLLTDKMTKDNMPTLILKNATILTTILKYIADQAAPGTIAHSNDITQRAVLQNVLSFVSTEVHPSI